MASVLRPTSRACSRERVIREDRDRIIIDGTSRRIELAVDSDELDRRRRGWVPPKPCYTRGVLAKYARAVGSAADGATTSI